MSGTELSHGLREAQAEIRRSREGLIEAGLALRAQVHDLADWRGWYRRAPGVWLGGAFLVGWFLGRRARLAPPDLAAVRGR